MTKLETLSLGKVLEKLEDQSDKMDQVVRGLYGDEANKVKGLIERQDDDEEKWRQLEPILINAEKIPKMVNSYNFWTSKSTWAVITTIGGSLLYTVLNWATIVEVLFR